MFREFAVKAVVAGPHVTFVFERPVSILTLAVSDTVRGSVWEFAASEFEPVPEGTEVSVVAMWPLENAPPEAVEFMKLAQASADQRLEEFGPSKPLIDRVRYGEVPNGYKVDSRAQDLLPGTYHLIVIAEQGHGRAEFSIGAT